MYYILYNMYIYLYIYYIYIYRCFIQHRVDYKNYEIKNKMCKVNDIISTFTNFTSEWNYFIVNLTHT